MRIKDEEFVARHKAARELNTRRWFEFIEAMHKPVTEGDIKYAHTVCDPLIKKYQVTKGGLHNARHSMGDECNFELVVWCARLLGLASSYSISDPTKISRRSYCGSYGLKHKLERWLARITDGKHDYVSNGEGILAAFLFADQYPDRIKFSGLRVQARSSIDPNIDCIRFGKWFDRFADYELMNIDQLTYKDIKMTHPLAQEFYNKIPRFANKVVNISKFRAACKHLERCEEYQSLLREAFNDPESTIEDIILREFFEQKGNGKYVFKQSGDEYECARYGLSTVILNKVCSLVDLRSRLDQKESRR